MVAVLFRTLDVLRIFDLPYILTGGANGTRPPVDPRGQADPAGLQQRLGAVHDRLHAIIASPRSSSCGSSAPTWSSVRRGRPSADGSVASRRKKRLKGLKQHDHRSAPRHRRRCRAGGRAPRPGATTEARPSAATSAWRSSCSGAWPRSTGWSSRPSATSGYTFDTTPGRPTSRSTTSARRSPLTRGNHFGQALLNSVIIGAATTVIAMMVGVFAAYALARLQFRVQVPHPRSHPGRLDVPAESPWSRRCSRCSPTSGWLQGWNYQAMIMPDISFALPLAIYTLTAFFGELPWDLEEAARIDGCTPGQAFRKVMLPLAAPGLFTTAILAFIRRGTSSCSPRSCPTPTRTTTPSRSRWRSPPSAVPSRTRSPTPR